MVGTYFSIFMQRSGYKESDFRPSYLLYTNILFSTQLNIMQFVFCMLSLKILETSDFLYINTFIRNIFE